MKSISWYCNLMFFSVFQWRKTFFRSINHRSPVPPNREITNNPVSPDNNRKEKAESRQVAFILLVVLGLFINSIINYAHIFFPFTLDSWMFDDVNNLCMYAAIIFESCKIFVFFMFLNKRKYLKYFREFGKMDKSRIKRYNIVNGIVLVCMIGLSIYSFKYFR